MSTLTAYRLLAWLWQAVPDGLQLWVQWLLNPKVVVGVSGVILDEQGRVLLVEHRFHHQRPWGLPGGWIQRGETVDQGWVREVREELGCQVIVDRILSHRSRGLSLEFILLGRLVGDPVLDPDPNELLDARFFSPHELPPGLRPDHRRAIQLALGQATHPA